MAEDGNDEPLSDSDLETTALAYHLFGHMLDERTFSSRLLLSESRDHILSVANRVLFVDYLGYRLNLLEPTHFFAPSFKGAGDLSYSIRQQVESLRLYLLCTCIDCLGGAGSGHLSPHDWLARTACPEDEGISAILNAVCDVGGLHNPTVFRHTAHKILVQVYNPTYGTRSGFNRFFGQLPPAVQRLIGEAYVVCGPMKEDPTASVLTSQGLGDFRSDWEALPCAKRCRRVATYLYDLRRNPYTHRLESHPPHIGSTSRVQGQHADLLLDGQYLSTNDIIVTGPPGKRKHYLRHFRGEAWEGEVLFLRFIVAMKILSELGFHSDDEGRALYRRWQVEREFVYRALWQVDEIERTLRTYLDDRFEVESAAGVWPPLLLDAVGRLRMLLRESQTPAAKGLCACIHQFWSAIEPVASIVEQHNRCLEDLSQGPTRSESGSTLHQHLALLPRLRSMIRSGDCAQHARLLRHVLNECSDRGVWW